MNPPAPNSESRAPNAEFVTTHWSVVLAAGQQDLPQAAECLEKLCRTYWSPLYAFIRRSGHDEQDAKDLTQGFFERLLAKSYLQQVDRSRGRFRSFLLASVKHFLANERDRQNAQRRGGSVQLLSLDAYTIEALESREQGANLTLDKIFERRWALALLETVRRRLAQEYTDTGKAALFDAVQVYLSRDGAEPTYAETAARLNLSVDAVKKAVERLRRRYGEILREEIAHTVVHPSEIDDEIRFLRAALQS